MRQGCLLLWAVIVGWSNYTLAEDRVLDRANVNSPARVLLVTGVDYVGHPWKQTGPALRDVLERDKQLDVRIIEDPELLSSETVFDYDLIFLHFKNYEPHRREEKIRENLTRFVREGGGLALLH